MPVASTRISQETYDRIQEITALEGITVSDLIRQYLEDIVDKGLHNEDAQGNLNNRAFALFQSQLESKDSQIERLHEQIDQLHQLLAMKERSVDALTSQLGTAQDQIGRAQDQLEDMRTKEKRSWWERITGK